MNDEKEKEKEKPGDKPEKKGVIGRLKKIKHIEIIIAVIAVVVMLIIYFSTKSGLGGGASTGGSNNLADQQEDYCRRMERSLNETISRVNGAGDASVIVNWESGVEKIIAYIKNNSQNSSSETPSVIQNNGVSGPIVLKEIYPKPLGILIVCSGGGNVTIQLSIINAVSTLMDITPDKITVLPMKSK